MHAYTIDIARPGEGRRQLGGLAASSPKAAAEAVLATNPDETIVSVHRVESGEGPKKTGSVYVKRDGKVTAADDATKKAWNDVQSYRGEVVTHRRTTRKPITPVVDEPPTVQ